EEGPWEAISAPADRDPAGREIQREPEAYLRPNRSARIRRSRGLTETGRDRRLRSLGMSDPFGRLAGMKQLSLPCKGRGGYRPGSGRKRGNRVTHHGRESFRKPFPLHVVWRTRRDVRSLRGKRLW